MSDRPRRQERLNTNNMVKVLVIGETGSGKSTFINYLTNYFKNGSLHNLKVAIPSKYNLHVTENYDHHEHNVNDNTQSKTDSCNQYMFTDGNFQYLFVDTPGLSDTRGTEQDSVNLCKILDAVDHLAGLTGIIIVVNGTVARLTVNLRNVIAQLRGNLPDIVMDNVIVVLTNTSRHSSSFSLAALELNGNVYPYYMQNSAFSADPNTRTSSTIQALEFEWRQSMSELKAMIKMLNTFKTKSVAAFKHMKDIRNSIKTIMHAARLEVTQMQKMQDEIAMFEAGLQQANADANTYKDYVKERTIDTPEIIDAKYHSTLCQNCNHVCHDNCQLDETTILGAQIFLRCWAMKGGNCTQCQHNCSYTAHYHAKKTVIVTKQTLKDILADIKSRYDAATHNSSDFQKKIKNTADAKKMLENALQQKNAEIRAKCTELRRICSGFNLAAELHALIDQLEIEATMLRNIEARKQANIFIRSLKEFCESIEKDQREEVIRSSRLSTMTVINTEQSVEGQNPISYSTTAKASLSEQNNNISMPKSDSYASEEVLNQIGALSGDSLEERKKKKRKPESKETSQYNARPTNESDQSEDDSDEEKISTTVKPKATKKETPKAKSSSTHTNTDDVNFDEIKILPTIELVKRYRTCGDQRIQHFIRHELTERSHGKSMAPLTDPADIATFMTNTQKYCSFDANSLKITYERLKEQVCTITDPDFLKIEKCSLSFTVRISCCISITKECSYKFKRECCSSIIEARGAIGYLWSTSTTVSLSTTATTCSLPRTTATFSLSRIITTLLSCTLIVQSFSTISTHTVISTKLYDG